MGIVEVSQDKGDAKTHHLITGEWTAAWTAMIIKDVPIMSVQVRKLVLYWLIMVDSFTDITNSVVTLIIFSTWRMV